MERTAKEHAALEHFAGASFGPYYAVSFSPRNTRSMEQLLEELRQIQRFALLYPPQSEKGLNRVSLVLSKQTLAQHSLAKGLGLDTLRAAKEGNTRATA